MPDYRVKFVGDLGNLAQFDRAVSNSLGASAQALQKANLRIAQNAGAGPLSLLGKDSQAGRFATNIKTEIDSVNRSFIQSGSIVRRYLADFEQVKNKETGLFETKPVFADEYIGEFKKIVGGYDNYLSALKQVSVTESQINSERLSYNKELSNSLNEQARIQDQIHGLQGAAGAVATQKYTTTPTQATLKRLFGEDPAAYAETYDKAIARIKRDIESVENKALTLVPKLTFKDSSTGRFTAPSPGNQRFAATIQGLQSVANLQSELEQRQETLRSGKGPSGVQLLPAQLEEVRQQSIALKGILDQIPNNIATSKEALVTQLQGYEEALAGETAHITQEITTLQAELERLKGVDAQQAAALEQRISTLRASNPAYNRLDTAASGTPPINAALKRTLEQSKDLRKQLLAGGLGEGERYDLAENSPFTQALAAEEAQVTKFNKNMRTGVTQIEGSVKRLNQATGAFDIEEGFTAEIDKNGKVITRWGGQLSGAGSILRQTVRDFQKVIEWTIATTAVFGTLGLAIGSLKTINDLNTALTRFSITAQLSVGDAKDVFVDLGKVAIDTATPLVDLVKVADDIALATKTAGDSTDEWKAKIIQLTTAVGIFTNLTGEDTVQGADKLSSAFKQLSLAPKDLINVLNKVTAVAGGQSTAINDIVTALGGVGEAGKAAGLSLDQQIGLVQVLGQVTNKSAADTATAFKNLFGSISSPGSEKILKEFGIDIRDAQGGLRPFLDIYREINKALEAGIIPANRYQDVLRGISGGPRRAPDAAALLGNLPAVEAAIARSAGATNEALIANAKVLDTNAAKITQLQNSFDIAIFEKFGDAVQKATSAVAGGLTAILDAFAGIDPALIATVLQFGVMLAAGKALVGLGNKLGPVFVGAFKGIGKTLTESTAGLVKFGQAMYIQEQLNNNGSLKIGKNGVPVTAGSVTAGLLSPTAFKNGAGAIKDYIKNLGGLRTTLVALGSVAALTLGQQASSGNLKLDPSVAGSFLQLAGTISLATGVFAPLGVAALVAGTALQVFGQHADETKVSAHDASVAVYEAIQTLKQSREAVKTAESAQEDAKAKLDAINATGKKDVETKQLQIDATDTFVTATLALANANKVASDSYDALLLKLPKLGEKYAAFQNIAGKGINASQADIDLLSQQLAAEILKIQGLGTLILGPLSSGGFKTPPLTAPINNPTQEQRDIAAVTKNQTLPGDFFPDYLKPENLNKLFDVNTGKRTDVNIPVSQENLRTLAASINDITTGKAKVNFNQDQIDTLQKAVYDFLAANDSFFEAQVKVASDAARVTALTQVGALTGDKATNAQNRVDIEKALQEALGNNTIQFAPNPNDTSVSPLERSGTPQGIGISKEEIRDLINKISSGALTGEALDPADLTKVATYLLTINQTLDTLKGTSDQALKKGMADSLIQIGFNAEDVNRIFGVLPNTIAQSTEEMDKLKASFEQANVDAVTKFAQRNASLQNAANSGDYDKNAKGLAALRAQSEAAYKSELKLIASFKALATGSAADQAAFAAVQKSLTGVVGLENAATINSDQLAGTLIDEAIAAGVSAAGIRKLQTDIAKLIALGDLLNRVKATFHLKANVDVSGAIKALEALFSATVALTKLGGGGPGLTEYLHSLRSAIDQLKAYENLFPKSGGDSNASIIQDINKIIASGSGSGLGKLPTGSKGTKSGPDVSELDLPDEVANASNRDALIQEAIKRARALQSKIPGATKDAKNDIVELLKGTQRILEVRGVKDDFLRKALEELAAVEKKRLEFDSKANTIQRIRVGSGSFAALANVPLNTQTGVSVGGPEGPVTVNLNINGQLLTPAQFAALADQIAAAIKRQLGA